MVTCSLYSGDVTNVGGMSGLIVAVIDLSPLLDRLARHPRHLDAGANHAAVRALFQPHQLHRSKGYAQSELFRAGIYQDALRQMAMPVGFIAVEREEARLCLWIAAVQTS